MAPFLIPSLAPSQHQPQQTWRKQAQQPSVQGNMLIQDSAKNEATSQRKINSTNTFIQDVEGRTEVKAKGLHLTNL